MNVDKHDPSPDIFRTTDADVQLTVYPALGRRRVLHVIIPTDAALVVEEELLGIARKYGKIKIHFEDRAPAKPAGQN